MLYYHNCIHISIQYSYVYNFPIASHYSIMLRNYLYNYFLRISALVWSPHFVPGVSLISLKLITEESEIYLIFVIRTVLMTLFRRSPLILKFVKTQIVHMYIVPCNGFFNQHVFRRLFRNRYILFKYCTIYIY